VRRKTGEDTLAPGYNRHKIRADELDRKAVLLEERQKAISYWFWLTVGAAILAKAIAQSWLVAATFLFGFYVLLVGSKVLVALLAGRSRDLLAGRPYRVVMRLLAVLLGCFTILLFREGLKCLAVI
jgi:hypothetical protein